MTHYINLEKKRLVGRNNQPIAPLQTDYSTVTEEKFTFIDSNNKIVEIPASAGLYYAGSLKMNQTPSSLLWLCEDFSLSGNELTFTNLDTYTSGYMREIKKKYTEVNIEIGVSDGENKKVLLRDTALANPRVYIDGIDPHSIIIPDYATKDYVDAAVSGKQDLITSSNKLSYTLISGNPTIPTKTSDLVNDSGFATSSYVDEALSGKLDAVTPVITSTDPYILNLSGNASYIWDLSESTYTATIQVTGVYGQEQTWAVDIKLGASASVFYYFGFKADECDSLTANKVNHCVVRWDGTYARLYCYAINDLA